MNIDIKVKDRDLTNSGDMNIPSGSQNDTYIKFHFEPGFGWESMTSITAVFSRSECTAYRVNIDPDVYVAIPSSVLLKPGNIFVSLVGYKNGLQVATTGTTPLVVEYNNVSIINTNVPLPLNSCQEFDKDAYAQYVAFVNAAANRAESAARELESVTIGWYTREECDNKFAKRVYTTFMASKQHDCKYAMPETYPSITVYALPYTSNGSIEDPVDLKYIKEISVKSTTDATTVTSAYSGLNLRYLSSTNRDFTVLDKHGAAVTQMVYVLSVADNPGLRVSDTEYKVSLVTCPEVNTAYTDECITNVGHLPLTFDKDSVTLTVPPGTSDEQISAIKIWYPMLNPVTKVISVLGLPMFTTHPSIIVVDKTVDNEVTSVESFLIGVEINVPQYLDMYNSNIDKVLTELDQVKQDVSRANQAVEDVSIKLDEANTALGKIDTVESTVETLSTNVEDISSNVETLSTDIEDISGKVDTLTSTVESTSGKVDTLTSTVESTSGKVDTLSTSIEDFDSQLETMSSTVTSTSGKVDTLSSTVTSTSGKVDTLNGTVESLNGTVESLNGTVESLNGTVESLNGTVESLNGTVESISTKTETVSKEVGTLKTTVNGIDTDVDNLVESINTALDAIDKLTVIKSVTTTSDQWVTNEGSYTYTLSIPGCYVLMVYKNAESTLTPDTYTTKSGVDDVIITCTDQADRIIIYVIPTKE